MKNINPTYQSTSLCPDSDTLLRFSKGEIVGGNADQIEKHIASCSMCSDELEGILQLGPNEELSSIVSELNALIDSKAQKKHRLSVGYWLGIAASLALVLSISFLSYYYFSGLNSNHVLAENLYRNESVWKGKYLGKDLPNGANHTEVSTSNVGKTNGKRNQAASPVTLANEVATDQEKSDAVYDMKLAETVTVVTLGKVETTLPKPDSAPSTTNSPKGISSGLATVPAPSITASESTVQRAKSERELASQTSERKKINPGLAINTTETMGGAEKTSTKSDEVFIMVEEMPQFYAKEYSSFLEYIRANLPNSVLTDQIQGTIYIEFIVEPDGKVSNTRIVKGLTPEIDSEVLKVVEKSPPWKPGRQRGAPVRVSLTHQLKISLN